MISLASYFPSSFNPACYIPSAVNKYLPTAVACPPPPTVVSKIYHAVISPISATYGTVRAILETLVGLPFLSFVVLLTNGGWSTTANVFFFYITWSTLVLSHPPLRVELIASLAVRLVFYVIPSLVFLALDLLLPPSSAAAEPVKAYATRSAPLAAQQRRQAGNAATTPSSRQRLWILGWSLANTILVAPLAQLAIELVLTNFFQGPSAAVRVTTALPAPITILKNIVQGYAIRELSTYAIHRLVLHERGHHNSSNSGSNIAARYHDEWYHTHITTPYLLPLQ
ncbi:hypothetical protein DV735_g4279, partial [Chaetothyriales sp. CBS 134920]